MIPFVYVLSIVIFIGGFLPWLSLVDVVRESTGLDILAQSMLLLWFGLLIGPLIFHHYAEIRADKKTEASMHKTAHTVFYVIGGIVILILLPMVMLIAIPTIAYLFGGHFE